MPLLNFVAELTGGSNRNKQSGEGKNAKNLAAKMRKAAADAKMAASTAGRRAADEADVKIAHKKLSLRDEELPVAEDGFSLEAVLGADNNPSNWADRTVGKRSADFLTGSLGTTGGEPPAPEDKLKLMYQDLSYLRGNDTKEGLLPKVGEKPGDFDKNIVAKMQDVFVAQHLMPIGEEARCTLCRHMADSAASCSAHILASHKPELTKEMQRWQMFVGRNVGNRGSRFWHPELGRNTQCPVCMGCYGELERHLASEVWARREGTHIKAFVTMKEEESEDENDYQ